MAISPLATMISACVNVAVGEGDRVSVGVALMVGVEIVLAIGMAALLMAPADEVAGVVNNMVAEVGSRTGIMAWVGVL